ncbi:MAG: hypothetical protein JNK82_03435 [Myxococcaceae bacterium]|nr:hypothetical protein [Myxococcaceae bacterium]
MTLAPVVLLLASQVSLPLERFEQLIQKKEEKAVRSFTVVESARLSGSFAKGFFIVFTGRSVGDSPEVALAGGDTVLQGCTSDQAVLTRTADQVHLTPLGTRFSVRCGYAAPAGEGFTLKLHGIADVTGAVADGTASVTAGSDGVVSLEVKRPEPKAEAPAPLEEKELPPTVVGRYRVTVLPDEGRFRWELEAHNPNRRAVTFPLPVRANEQLEKLETSVQYEVTADGFAVHLPPGDTKLAVNGAMKGARFEPPIDAAVQFVLLDSHPLLRLEVDTAGKRLSPNETGLKAEYSGAQGFLLARGQSLQWKATVLETLPSLSYTVPQLTSSHFVGPNGEVLAESLITLENEGAAEVTLPVHGTPEYASIDGTSVPLTNTAAGDLRLPLTRGAQALRMMHNSKLQTGFGFAAGTLELPGLGTAATSSRVELRAGSDWVPLFHTFGGHRWFALPRLGEIVLALVFGAWAVHLLVSFGLKRRQSLVLGGLTAVFASSTSASHWPVVCALAGGSMLFVGSWLRESKVKLVAPSGLVGGLIVMGLGMVMMVGTVTLFGDNIRRLFGMSADALAGDDVVSQRYGSGLTNKTMQSFGQNAAYGYGSSAPAPAPVAGYSGAAAARQMPRGEHRVSLSNELVDTRSPSSARVVLISAPLVHTAWGLLHLLAFGLAFFMRRQLLEGIKGQVVRLFAARPAVTEPQPSIAAAPV